MERNKRLFLDLYRAPVEGDVDRVLDRYGYRDSPQNWVPYGRNKGNFGIIENQQASPIAALIEKVTNGIDAILMRKCLEAGIDPKGPEAPRSIEAAMQHFFPGHKYWHMPTQRRDQARELQILAHGPKRETSLVVYDGGEGQRPNDFENTFLSLNRNNKTAIQFVQGKYNMGGTGALVFCGKRRFQLIGSRRFDSGTPFGFTLVRRHRLDPSETQLRATWYEYLVIDGAIPSFETRPMDLGLFRRTFDTGTVVKLYSYELPPGSRSVISRDLNQSINEYLFRPALPVYTIDTKERYPDDRALQRSLYGLQSRLDENKVYIETKFSNDWHTDMGHLRVTGYVFRVRAGDRSVKETLRTIRSEFFKNNMAVLFSMNGQVHGHYTSEFTTQTLKFALLKNYLLIHVDCTDAQRDFRNELFMASRDRLKKGAESARLRRELGLLLTQGKLKDIHRRRRASIAIDDQDAETLVRNLARELPIKGELADLLKQTFDLKDRRSGTKRQTNKQSRGGKRRAESPFSAKRFPTFFQAASDGVGANKTPVLGVPAGGQRTIRFSTDVEDEYFDRADEPGALRIEILTVRDHEGSGSRPRQPSTRILNVVKSSPDKGTIRVRIAPGVDARVGENIRVEAALASAGEWLRQIFEVRITAPEEPPKPRKDKNSREDRKLGLPALKRVHRSGEGEQLTWEQAENSGISMDHDVIVHLESDGDKLAAIYVNMDSRALLTERQKATSEEAISVVEKRYISAVYFHALFLYTITKNRRYALARGDGAEGKTDTEVSEYIADLFSNHYARFLMSFDTRELLAALDA